jgi:hypothetical protein
MTVVICHKIYELWHTLCCAFNIREHCSTLTRFCSSVKKYQELQKLLQWKLSQFISENKQTDKKLPTYIHDRLSTCNILLQLVLLPITHYVLLEDINIHYHTWGGVDVMPYPYSPLLLQCQELHKMSLLLSLATVTFNRLIILVLTSLFLCSTLTICF